MLKFSEMKSGGHKNEIMDALHGIVKTMPAYKELVYFVKIVRDHYLTDFEKGTPDIIVLGSNIPEELVLAAGKMPYWILGGSRASSLWADGLVPRDTDPVSRSSLGYLEAGFAEKSLILIPLVNDSARKLAYILKSQGLKVHTVHFPPIKDMEFRKEWNRQYESCRSVIAGHLKRPLTRRTLQRAMEKMEQAKKQIQEFLSVSQGVLNGTGRMLVLTSYYCTDDLDEWSRQLRGLTERLGKEKNRKEKGRNKVLLLGSPIYFPNYKVPFLIEEAGLSLFLQADYTSLPLQVGSLPDNENREEFAENVYSNDASPAYVKNDSLYRQIVKLVSENQIDGVVYHVLKGQIEYDFELGRLEELFENMGIPVFRLETDYNYQDVAQLRIRLEAFSEVLNQRTYSGLPGTRRTVAGTAAESQRTNYGKDAVAI